MTAAKAVMEEEEEAENNLLFSSFALGTEFFM